MLPVVIALFLAFAPQQPPASNAPLRIVVLQGENAVNIIQQKTAVAPLVEIRDRNNIPVAGASVTFTIGGNSAAFAGGAQTLTVVTNAAGQAAAAGLSPVASGAVQINVAAAFQGQTIAATIAQTNVMTAAEAAGAASAAGGATGASGGSGGATGGAAGGAAGGGGGLSATTIAIAGAAVAGGAVAATQVIGGGGTRELAGNFTLQLTIAFGACVRVERYSGLLALEFDSLDSDTLNGKATIENGRVDYVSTTPQCTTGPQAGQTDRWGMDPTPVSGPKGSVTFTRSDARPPATNSYDFQGSVTGESATGTLRYGYKVDNGALGIAQGLGSVTVTLTPH